MLQPSQFTRPDKLDSLLFVEWGIRGFMFEYAKSHNDAFDGKYDPSDGIFILLTC